MPGTPHRYWLAGQWLRFNTVHCRGAVPRRSCGFGRRSRAAACGFGCRCCSLARSGGNSSAVASAGTPTRLSARAGRTSLHHPFACACAVSARRASALAWAFAQPQVERTGRKQRATINHPGGLPLTNTLGCLIVVPRRDRVHHLLAPSPPRWHACSAARFACACETHVPGKARRY